ncbi:MAG: hypothetical protein IT548_14980 [Alphaproteobacteria bacterium]|nr:hypothetical protein [Alphaproteobacteria bacterium]
MKRTPQFYAVEGLVASIQSRPQDIAAGLMSNLSGATKRAIGAVWEECVPDTREAYKAIKRIARFHGARIEPVLAFFGFVRPFGRPRSRWVHMYQARLPYDSICWLGDDVETLSAHSLALALGRGEGRYPVVRVHVQS